jgi:hypothetical protein
MNYSKALLTAAGITLFSSTAFAVDCNAPEMPNVPEGDTATQSQMDQAKAEVSDFAQESEAYLECLSDKAANATADERRQISNMYDDMLRNVDEATADMQQAASEFQQRVATNMREADAATQDEQDMIAEMYHDIVDQMRTASNDVKEAWQDYQDETEEAE